MKIICLLFRKPMFPLFLPLLEIDILIFETVFWTNRQRVVLKKNRKNQRHLCLATHIFTKLSQNVYLINTHILEYRHDRLDCKLWNAHWFYCLFCIFIHKWRLFVSEVLCIWVMYLFWYINMSDGTASYGTFLDYLVFFVNSST